jgi:hypothetical protein
MRSGAIAITVAAALALLTPGSASSQSAKQIGVRRSPPADTSTRRSAALDTLTSLWSNDAFSTLIDGQPNSPGGAELDISLGWLNLAGAERPLLIGFVPSYTPAWTDFSRNMQLSLPIPMLWGSNGLRFGNIGIAWQQRWVADLRRKLALSSYLGAGFTPPAGINGVTATLTGIGVMVMGSGVGFLNGSMLVSSSDGLVAWSFLGAYKLPVSAGTYLSADYAFAQGRNQRSVNLLDLAAVFSAGSHLTISPGAVIGLGHRDVTPRWGAGVRLVYFF